MSGNPPPLYDDVRPVLERYRDDIPWVSRVTELRTAREIRQRVVEELEEILRDGDAFLKMGELLEREYVIESGTVTPPSSVQLQCPFATNDEVLSPRIKHRIGERAIDDGRVAVVSDVTLYGDDAVAVTSDGNYLLPDGDGTVTHLACLTGSAARDYDPGEKNVEHYGTVVSFTGVSPSNYYHWWIEHAPKLLAVAYYEEKHGVTPTILVPEEFPEWAETMFREFGYWKYVETWSGGVARVEEFVLMTGGCIQCGYHDPSIMDWLHTVMTNRFASGNGSNQSSRSADGSGARGEHIFISRADEGSRTVANREAVLDALPDTFEVYELAPMSFREQVELFRDAEIIVAPHGAGLTNMVWATDAVVIEIFGEIQPGLYYDLAAVCGHSYAYGMFSRNDDNQIVADPKVIAEMVENVLRSDGRVCTFGPGNGSHRSDSVEWLHTDSSNSVDSSDVCVPPLAVDLYDVICRSPYGDALFFSGDEQLQIRVSDSELRRHVVPRVTEMMNGDGEVVVSTDGVLPGSELVGEGNIDESQHVMFEHPVTGSNPIPEAVSEIVGCEQTLSRVPVRVLQDVSLHGSQAAVTTARGKYVLDDALCDVAVLGEKAGRALVECISNPGSFGVDRQQRYDVAVSLVGVRGDCPERWFTYQLPKLRAFDAYVAETGVTPTILVPDGLPGWAWRSLELLGYADHAELWDGGVAVVDEFILTHGAHPVRGGSTVQAEPLEWLREKFKTVAPVVGGSSRDQYSGAVDSAERFSSYVYLYHGDGAGVRVKNVERLLNALPDGFEAYDLAALSLDEIIAVFRNSDVVVGAHGPWLVGVLWCDAPVVFVEILTRDSTAIPYQIACVTGTPYGGVAYPADGSGVWVHVGVDEVSEIVSQEIGVGDSGGSGSGGGCGWVPRVRQLICKSLRE